MLQFSKLDKAIDAKNKMGKHVICLMIVICGLTTSCIYYPHLTSVPLIKEKGDTRIEGGVGLVSQSLQVSFSQGATEKIAYQLAASMDPYGYYSGSPGLYAQGAIGTYKNIQSKNVMELYGGFAYGSSCAYNDANPGNLHGNYQVYFAQFNYGDIEQRKANLEYGLGLKAGFLHSKMTDKVYFFSRDDYSTVGPYPVYRINGLLLEPTLFLRFGGKRLKFFTTLGASLYHQLNHTDKCLPTNPFNLGLGISYSLMPTKNKKLHE